MAKGKSNTTQMLNQSHTALLLLSFLFMCLVSSSAFSAVRIIGGEEVDADEVDTKYPWMVSLRDSVTGLHLCGGSLIDEKWVLSATHCNYQQAAGAITAVIGDYDLTLQEETEQRIDIVRQVESGRDLMLLELAEAVDTKKFPILNIADPSIMDSVAVGQTLTMIGWGATSVGAEYEYPSILNEALTSLVSQNDCSEAYGILTGQVGGGSMDPLFGDYIDAGHLCVKGVDTNNVETGVSSCSGDSGGPVLYESNGEYIQLGLASFSDGNCSPSKPQVYTRVSPFYDWIQSIINQIDLDVASTIQSADIVVSLLSDEYDNNGKLKYELEVIDSHTVTITNNALVDFSIESVAVELLSSVPVDDETTENIDEGQDADVVAARTRDYVRVSASDGSDGCADTVLLPGGSCQMVIESHFLNKGSQTINLVVTKPKELTEEAAEQLSFEIVVNPASATDYARSFGENLYWYQKKRNEWVVLEDDADENDEDYFQSVYGVQEIYSNLKNYSETNLIAKVVGAGELCFDWRVDHLYMVQNPDDLVLLDFTLSVNGVNVATQTIADVYTRECLRIEGTGLNTLVFSLSQSANWPENTDTIEQVSSLDARIKSARFTPDVVEEEEAPAANDSGGGAFGFGMFILFLMAFLRNKRCGYRLSVYQGLREKV